ncbi:hypothetical protein EOE18_04095 [Novosphingobium umbonatum]|uniref:Uncharacterized protein n=2 Tax=Novosphingobium umbonatum TaxID=1908524 RepID=A0A3S2UUB7_9SPHN|nr:hypothetical protein EOE18_04095 [Novosphingobium umbonatum]
MRISTKAAALEKNLLALLRYVALLVAVMALVGSLGFLAIGMVNQLGETEVKPGKVAVQANELIPAQSAKSLPSADIQPIKPSLDKATKAKTLEIFRSRFKPSQRPDDKLTDDQVVDFIWTDSMLSSYADLATAGLTDAGGKDLTTAAAIMGDALTAVDTAAQNPEFQKKLTAYRTAQKQNVCTDHFTIHSRLVPGWDSTATNCEDWYKSPVGCAGTRLVEEPVTEKVCEMKFPEGLLSPVEQYAIAVATYAETAKHKSDDAKIQAQNKTSENGLRKEMGKERIQLAAEIFLGFLGIMFLYLFIALERHNRSLRLLIKEVK